MFCKEHYISPTSLRNWMKCETTKPIKFLQVTESPTEKVELNALADNIKIEFRCVAVSFSFVIGRKNFLFSNTLNGAASTARVYSIIQTALANNLKPQHYLQYVFERIQENPDIDINQILPWSKEIPEYCKNK